MSVRHFVLLVFWLAVVHSGAPVVFSQAEPAPNSPEAFRFVEISPDSLIVKTVQLDGAITTQIFDVIDEDTTTSQNILWSPDGNTLLIYGGATTPKLIFMDRGTVRDIELPAYLYIYGSWQWLDDTRLMFFTFHSGDLTASAYQEIANKTLWDFTEADMQALAGTQIGIYVIDTGANNNYFLPIAPPQQMISENSFIHYSWRNVLRLTESKLAFGIIIQQRTISSEGVPLLEISFETRIVDPHIRSVESLSIPSENALTYYVLGGSRDYLLLQEFSPEALEMLTADDAQNLPPYHIVWRNTVTGEILKRISFAADEQMLPQASVLPEDRIAQVAVPAIEGENMLRGTLSPLGNQMAFVLKAEDGTSDLYIYDGAELMLLLNQMNSETIYRNLSWSPNAAYVTVWELTPHTETRFPDIVRQLLNQSVEVTTQTKQMLLIEVATGERFIIPGTESTTESVSQVAGSAALWNSQNNRFIFTNSPYGESARGDVFSFDLSTRHTSRMTNDSEIAHILTWVEGTDSQITEAPEFDIIDIRTLDSSVDSFVAVEEADYPNCEGTIPITDQYTMSRTEEFSVELQQAIIAGVAYEVSAGAEASTVFATFTSEIRQEVSLQLEARFGSTSTQTFVVSRAVTLGANAGTHVKYPIQWMLVSRRVQVEIMQDGVVSYLIYTLPQALEPRLQPPERIPCT